MDTGATFEHTFNTTGEYTYKCTHYPSMKGKIVVEE
ncbi:MAG: cupredoxin domain-containing protein [Methermicoccaceae archaeon]